MVFITAADAFELCGVKPNDEVRFVKSPEVLPVRKRYYQGYVNDIAILTRRHYEMVFNTRLSLVSRIYPWFEGKKLMGWTFVVN